MRARKGAQKEKPGTWPTELIPVAIAKWLGGGVTPHGVRRWPEWSAHHVLTVMRAEAATS